MSGEQRLRVESRRGTCYNKIYRQEPWQGQAAEPGQPGRTENVSGFANVVGHEKTIAHLKTAIRSDKVSHAYLITGDAGMGKHTIANAFAKTLQCRTLYAKLHGDGADDKAAGGAAVRDTDGTGIAGPAAVMQTEEIDACGVCPSCVQAESGNHPDIITWGHSKPKTFGVDDVRELVSDIQVRPFSEYSPYKIYIVPDAQLMNAQAQNALLKTLEEPPEYAVLILLTTSADAMLETIRSRAVMLDLKPVDGKLIRGYLMKKLGQSDYEAQVCETFAQGNLGKAISLASSEDFKKLMELALRIVRNVKRWELDEIMEMIRELVLQKASIGDLLELFTLWYRDVLVFKATRDPDAIVFRDQITDVRRASQTCSYEGVETVLLAIDKARVRLKANVSFELTMELLLLTMKEN